MKKSSLSLVGLIVAVSFFMLRSFVVSTELNAVIYSSPSENMTVSLGQKTLVKFTCLGDGENFLWVVNGTRVYHNDQSSYGERGIVFYPERIMGQNGGINITIGINVTTTRNNNTMLNCFALNTTTEIYSPVITLMIAGPPLAPHPNFRVVNATHIEVQWDKPFVLPEFDVRNYTLLIANTNSDGDIESRNELFLVSEDTPYPIRYHISNGGEIPKECVSLKYTIIATNDAGTSKAGSVTGGFPIAPSPIPDDPDSLQYWVTLSSNFIPVLHINFTFPKVCIYDDVKYSVVILDGDGSIVYQSMQAKYDNNSPDIVEVVLNANLQNDSSYIAQINVSTSVNWTTLQLNFETPKQPSVDGTGGMTVSSAVIIGTLSIGGLVVAVVLLSLIVCGGIYLTRRSKRNLIPSSNVDKGQKFSVLDTKLSTELGNSEKSANPLCKNHN